MRRFGAGGKPARRCPRVQKGLDRRDRPGNDPIRMTALQQVMLASNLRHLSAFRVALLATLAVALAYLPGSQLGLVQQLEGELLDLRFHARPPQPTSGAITLVLIDDAESRRGRPLALEPQPDGASWSNGSRRRARGRSRSTCCSPSPSAAPCRPTQLEPLLQQGDALARLPELIEQAEGDRRLAAEATRAGNVVLPILFELAQGDAAPPAARAVRARRRVSRRAGGRCIRSRRAAGGRARACADRHARRGRRSARPRQRAARSQRRAALEYPVIGYGADYFPSFSLEIARHHLGVDRDRTRLLLGQGIALGERFVPTDESMRLPINYDRPGRFPAVSAAAVLRRRGRPCAVRRQDRADRRHGGRHRQRASSRRSPA